MASNPRNKVTHMPRKQRKAVFSGELHKMKRIMRAHVADDLMEKYDVWSVRVNKGDTVKIMRGGTKMKSKTIVFHILIKSFPNHRLSVDSVRINEDFCNKASTNR